MAEPKFKIESGMQLLSRLTKKPNIENFYPILFKSGPKRGDIIEINYESDTSWLLVDMITDTILPNDVNNGVEVLIFNTDGNLNFEILLNVLRNKISHKFNLQCKNTMDTIIKEALSRLHMLEIFDSNQFLITIHNLDNILMEHSNICLVVFNSLVAFYWSEQGFKITKMDLYIKNLLQIIHKFIKQYKIICVYSKPQYFISSKDSDGHSGSQVIPHYQISLNYHNNSKEVYKIDIKTVDDQYIRYFKIIDGTIKWGIE